MVAKTHSVSAFQSASFREYLAAARRRNVLPARLETDSRSMPEGELPPGCGGGKVGVGMKVALGLVFTVGVVPFDGHAI